MDKNLKKVRNQLRAERCPDKVLQRVNQQVERESRTNLLKSLRWGVAGLTAIGTFAFTISLLITPQEKAAPAITLSPDEPEITKEQVHLVLAYFGQTLNRASSQSSDIILGASLPSLRQGLRRTREVINKTK